MVSVEALWVFPIETMKLMHLGGYDVFEGPNESRMKDGACQRSTQVRSELVLALHKLCGGVWSRKGSCQVEVQTRIDFSFSGHRRGPLGILHEDHRAHRRHASA